MITRAAIIQDGVLYIGEVGERHHNVIHTIFTKTGKKVTGEQGFTDELKTFYTREEAAKLAIACGMVVEGKANNRHVFDGKRLYSEDLW
jgi:hypothetical protein